jgi:lauroyl/myristoyl acyltransferase
MNDRSALFVPRDIGFKWRLKDFYFTAIIHLFCLGEWLMGPIAVAWLAWPAILLDWINRRRDYAQFVRLRGGLPSAFWKGLAPARHYFQMVRTWQEVIGVSFTYHRWGLPRWQRRFRVTGTPPQQLPEWGQRPVILAFLHTSSFALVHYWMRSQGVPAAILLMGVPAEAKNTLYKKNLEKGDARFGVEGIPLNFHAMKEIREAIRFLQPGRVLVVALDGVRGTKETYPYHAGPFPIRVKEGACRIGAQTNAIIVPVEFTRVGACRYDVRFGKPVPDELIRSDNFNAATQHLVSELWPEIEKKPGILNWTTLEALVPALKAKRIGWP